MAIIPQVPFHRFPLLPMHSLASHIHMMGTDGRKYPERWFVAATLAICPRRILILLAWWPYLRGHDSWAKNSKAKIGVHGGEVCLLHPSHIEPVC